MLQSVGGGGPRSPRSAAAAARPSGLAGPTPRGAAAVPAAVRGAVFMTPGVSANFERLVLGCIEADVCE